MGNSNDDTLVAPVLDTVYENADRYAGKIMGDVDPSPNMQEPSFVMVKFDPVRITCSMRAKAQHKARITEGEENVLQRSTKKQQQQEN
jgi:hypothetical protein